MLEYIKSENEIILNKKTFRRYSRTAVRDKRSLVRSLNSFTKQYKYAFIEKVRLNSDNQIEFGKLIGLSFSQERVKPEKKDIEKSSDEQLSDEQVQGLIEEENNRIQKEDNKNIGKKYDGSGVIFNEVITDNDITNYKLILEAIDNLISINTKHTYKDALKAILEDYSKNGISNMLDDKNEDKVIYKIEMRFGCSSKYAIRIYSQLKNRIRYRYVGLYSINDEISNKVNILTPTYLTAYDELNSRIEYLLRREWLFNKDILSGLRDKITKLKAMENKNEEDEYDLVRLVSYYFNIRIELYDADNETYDDAVEFLKFLYLEEINEDSKYPNPSYTPYQYEFISEHATKYFRTQQDAIDYIEFVNDDILGLKDVDYIQEEFDEEEAQEHFKQRYEHPIEEETVNDTSLKDEFSESASSIPSQWNSFFDSSLDGILSADKKNNEYYKIHCLAVKLIAKYNLYQKNNLYLKDGAINEYSKVLRKQRQELWSQFKDFERKKKNEKIAEIVRIKKREWKLLYDTVNNNDFLYALRGFNYTTLEF